MCRRCPGRWGLGWKDTSTSQDLPFEPLKLTVDSAGVWRPCPGSCSPNINDSCNLEQKKKKEKRKQRRGRRWWLHEGDEIWTGLQWVKSAVGSPALPTCIVCTSHATCHSVCCLSACLSTSSPRLSFCFLHQCQPHSHERRWYLVSAHWINGIRNVIRIFLGTPIGNGKWEAYG